MQKAKFSFSGSSFALVFGAIWLAIGLIFLPIGLVLAWHEYQRSTIIPAEGERALGMVLTKTYSASSKDNSDPTYAIEYRFATREGRQITGTAKVARAEWALLKERGPVKVGYLPANPDINRVPSQLGDTVEAVVFSAVGGVFSLLGGMIAGIGLLRLLRRRRLASSGSSAQARVESVVETNYLINGVRQVAVRYRFQDSAGREMHGRSEPMPPEEAANWKPGDVGAVRYDAAAPQKNQWVGKEQA